MFSIYSVILLAVLSPVFIAILGKITFINKHRTLLEVCMIVGCLFCFVCFVYAAFLFFNGENFSLLLFNIMPSLKISWRIDIAGMVFALSVVFLWMCTIFYTITYMNDQQDIGGFFSLIAMTIFATFSAAFASNVITLFLSYELMTIITYPLVRYYKTDIANKSAKIYLLTLLSTSMSLFMPVIVYLYNKHPVILDFHSSSDAFINISTNEMIVLLLCIVYGSVKAALVPMHFWLPMAMVAPMPVSALLHAVAVVKTGVFVIIRMVFFVFNTVNIQIQPVFYVLTYVSIISIIYASICALREDSIKKRLAYSTIAQLSYITMLVSLRNNQAFIAAMLHMVSHAFAKITLFFCAGMIMKNTGKSTVNSMNGVASSMPFTMFCFTIAAASIIGIPPTIGFIDKYFIMRAFTEDFNILLTCMLSFSSLFSFLYLSPIVFRSLRKTTNTNVLLAKESFSWALFAIFLTTLAILICIVIPVDKIFIQ